MKGEILFKKATSLQDQLYDKNYIIEGKVLSKNEIYSLYIKYLRKSAYLGFPQAQYELAQTYENVNFWGANANYSPKKCIFWYKKACLNNYPAAYNNLAGFYENGEGVERDINKALILYKKASELGDRLGKKNYRLLLKQSRNINR